MPRKKVERHATILKKLQDNVRHTDSNVTAGRRLTIERWVKTYMRQVEYLKDDGLQFLYNVFQDESCWSGTKLNNTTLGQKLVEEKIGGIKNPLSRYDIACRYCVIDKIPQLFQEQLNSYRASFSAEELDDDSKPATRNDKYVRSELLSYMKGQDPVLSFWIDKKSGEFKKHDNAVEGFNKAVEFKWSEGVEYFYNHLKEDDKKKKITETVTALSSVQCNHNGTIILDFCFHIMSDQEKCNLSKKDKGVYSLLSLLIRHGFFDTVQIITPMFKDKILEEKIISSQDYTLLLYSLSDIILKNPELSTQARKIMMDLIKCGNFNNHKGKEEKAAVFFFGGIAPIDYALSGLIIDWANDNKRDSATNAKKSEILEILQFAKKFCSATDFKNFEESIVKNLRMISRVGMKDDIYYDELAKKLFSELEKKSPLPSRDSDPQPMLEGAGVSDFSDHRR
ncbi:hypothetical protein [Wolbachia endosymbiont (group B) of Longitarsus flavicornis]|uniref:hypothetical protein n=1 Tax=Wolbachia endosymbiont (group B) of Longitarsus flavicornis TaxID=3066135 RepID=UPI003342183D